MLESAIYLVTVFTSLLLTGGLGYTLFEFNAPRLSRRAWRQSATGC